MVLCCTGIVPKVTAADSAVSLIIDQIKITSDDQFVRLRNVGTGSIALSDYELIYLNSDNKPTKTLTFSGTVPKDGYFMLDDSQLSICYQMLLDSVSLGFSTTAGTLQLWHYVSPSMKVLESSVGWIKTRKSDTPAAIQTLPTQATGFLQRQWPVPTAPAAEWIGVQPSTTDPCVLLQISDNKPAPSDVIRLTPGFVPPVNTVTVPEGYVAPKNIDMLAPVLNELLPNPGSPQTDGDDEFFELYNPNDTGFDLGGYKIIYGSGTTPHTYTFPESTSLEPKSYTAFYSDSTSVSLSNSSGQVWLTDPNGTIISQTEPYGKAEDNQAWSLANGTWGWMTTATPGKPNDGSVIGVSSSKDAKSNTVGATGTVKGVSTSKPSTSAAQDLDDAAPLHPLVLAGIGIAAVGYAVYEYRHDIANRFFKIRRHLRMR
jgi:hypothetical protein